MQRKYLALKRHIAKYPEKYLLINNVAPSSNDDGKLRELLGTPEEDNQQPSLESNLLEGSTTSENNLSEIMSHHERGAPKLKLLIPIGYGPWPGTDIGLRN